jgi:hypothetical protein
MDAEERDEQAEGLQGEQKGELGGMAVRGKVEEKLDARRRNFF